MSRIPKRFLERFKGTFRKYQKILEAARSRDVNESDTVVIVSDLLNEMLGYDKYQDITTEFAVRSTFCDLAVKVDGQLLFLVEVKSIGTELKDNHLRQAVEYGCKEGCEWVVLTNGIEWQAHRIRFEQPVDSDLVFQISMLDPSYKPAHVAAHLSLLAKESGRSDMEKFFRQRQVTSRFVLAQVILHDDTLGAIRRQLRRLSPEVKVSREELGELLQSEVFKRELLEGDKAESAKGLVTKSGERPCLIGYLAPHLYSREPLPLYARWR